jgi:hypothetical protein
MVERGKGIKEASHCCNGMKINPPLPLPRGDLMDIFLVEERFSRFSPPGRG